MPRYAFTLEQFMETMYSEEWATLADYGYDEFEKIEDRHVEKLAELGYYVDLDDPVQVYLGGEKLNDAYDYGLVDSVALDEECSTALEALAGLVASVLQYRDYDVDSSDTATWLDESYSEARGRFDDTATLDEFVKWVADEMIEDGTVQRLAEDDDLNED